MMHEYRTSPFERWLESMVRIYDGTMHEPSLRASALAGDEPFVRRDFEIGGLRGTYQRWVKPGVDGAMLLDQERMMSLAVAADTVIDHVELSSEHLTIDAFMDPMNPNPVVVDRDIDVYDHERALNTLHTTVRFPSTPNPEDLDSYRSRLESDPFAFLTAFFRKAKDLPNAYNGTV